jgi:hypothetical protein
MSPSWHFEVRLKPDITFQGVQGVCIAEIVVVSGFSRTRQSGRYASATAAWSHAP